MAGNGKWSTLSCQSAPDGTTAFSATEKDASDLKAVTVHGTRGPDGTVEGSLTISAGQQPLLSVGTNGDVRVNAGVPSYLGGPTHNVVEKAKIAVNKVATACAGKPSLGL